MIDIISTFPQLLCKFPELLQTVYRHFFKT